MHTPPGRNPSEPAFGPREACLRSPTPHGAPATEGASRIPATDISADFIPMAPKKGIPFENHLHFVFKTARDTLLSKTLLRKKKRKPALSRPQVPCSGSQQHMLGCERRWARWMPCFQRGPEWRGTPVCSPTPTSSLFKSPLDSTSFIVACFTFKALHLQTVYFFRQL